MLQIIPTFSTFMSYMYNKEGKYEYFDYDSMTYSTRMFYGKIQHICLPLSPMLHIKRTFDLDICKSAWDGNNIYIKNWNKLFEKKDYIRPNTKIMELYTERRGYQCRMDKYTARGFDIHLHPNFKEIEAYINSLTTTKGKRNNINPILRYVRDGKLDLERFDQNIDEKTFINMPCSLKQYPIFK